MKASNLPPDYEGMNDPDDDYLFDEDGNEIRDQQDDEDAFDIEN